ncbi:hypothetical protein TrRE_jg368 [Triparma retinervis]|uniref:Uncharacterized protein n=1 Tax=Triparma retinervis TaxID=2557542 RepID=A0A9W6ZKZ9_9STRA|nr:hypothetical protein TrRE_jg368 [Triparma retinervis]
MPPSPVQYWSYQTNIFATFTSENEVLFPEVSPLPTVNHLTMGAEPGTPYVIVTTGDKDLADDITEALVNAGAPAESIHLDGISHPSLKVDGHTPDVLEAVVRINNKDFSPALTAYIEASPTEQLALFLDPINPPTEVNLLPASPLRQRSVEPDPGAPDFSSSLDSLSSLISKKLASSGYVMSYSGEMPESMDFGYDEADTNACCIDGYMESDTYWHSMVHFSTSDCLYRAHGAYSDPSGMWNDGNLSFVGNTLSVDYDVIGKEADVQSYSTFSCSEDNEVLIGYSCNDKCSEDVCKVSPLSAIPYLEGCVQFPDNDKLSVEFGCSDDGVAVESSFLGSDCTGIKISEKSVETCNNSTSHFEGELWAGGIAKDTTVSFVIGVRTNKLGYSSFHNVYLPEFSSYNDPDDQASFGEESLEGSAEQWGWEDDDLFVAEFSRECTGDKKFCKEINAAPGDTLVVMSRQYLDTRTLTGPDKDDIAPHRVLIFDKKQ